MRIKTGQHKPTYANDRAAGLDIRSAETFKLKKKENFFQRLIRAARNLVRKTEGKELIEAPHISKVKTKLAVELPAGHFGMVVARSGLSVKKQIKLINDVGIIDEDYRNDIGVILVNEGPEDYEVREGDRVAQMIIVPYIQAELEEAEELSKTKRGKKGFGSTGR